MKKLIGLCILAMCSSAALGDWSSSVLVSNPNAMAGFTGTVNFFNTSVKFPGDANCDGNVDVGDLGILAGSYGKIGGMTWKDGDFNSDGQIDVGDLGILASAYGNQGDVSSQRTLDVTVDYAVFAPGQYDGNFSGLLSAGYNPETDYVYAYQLYNNGPNQQGLSTVFLSYFGVNADTSSISAMGQDAGYDASDADFAAVRATILGTGAAFYFPMKDSSDPKLNPGLFSTVLLIASPVAPTFVPFTIMDSTLTDTRSLPFAAAVPTPASTLLAVMGLCMVGLLSRRSVFYSPFRATSVC